MYSTLQFIVSQLLQRDITTSALLHNTQIEARVLNDPWPYLNSEQYHALVTNIFELCPVPTIGLTLSQHFRARAMGIPGYAALSSATFADARKVLMQYRVLKDPFIYLSHSLDKQRWVITFDGVYPVDEAIMRFAIEGHIMRTARFCEDITGHNLALKSISLSYAAPDYADLYTELLPCPISFNQAANTIEFDHQVLHQSLPNADPVLLDLCQRECDAQLAQFDEQNAFQHKVHQELFRAHSATSNSLLSLYDVADRLYISPRTLRRKLLNENTSFQAISNDTRKDLALHYLQHSTQSTKEIAYTLGYSSVNNFHRAFKQWTGKPVSEYAKQTGTNS